MFDPQSRYFSSEEAILELPDGNRITYKRHRLLPRGERIPLLDRATVTPGERLDQLAARTLGDPLAFWQICDARNAMNPFDLIQESRGEVGIPAPKFEGEDPA